jgi:hypothetical protein
LHLTVETNQIAAEVYQGRVDPEGLVPALSVEVGETTVGPFTQFNVNGGYVFDTDNIRVTANGQPVLDEDFDDGDISAWRPLFAGEVDFEDDEGGGYVLRKSANGDPDGGSVDLREATLLTFDPATDGVDVNNPFGGYESVYGLVIDGGVFSTLPAFLEDGNGLVNSENLANESIGILSFVDPATGGPAPVGRIDFTWVRLYEDVDVIVTAYDAQDDIVYYFFEEGCPLNDCSYSGPSDTKTIIGEGIVKVTFEGTSSAASELTSTEIVGLDSLRFWR